MITFKPTRDADLVETVGNHPDIIAGSNNGDGYDYKPDTKYFEVHVHGEFGGIVYYHETQPLTFDCHAMYLPHARGFSKDMVWHSGDTSSPRLTSPALFPMRRVSSGTVRFTAR